MYLYFLDAQHVPAAAIGVVTAGIGLGGLAGSLVASSLVAKFGRGPVMLGANIVAAVSLAAVWAAPEAITGTIAYGLMAAAVSVWNVPWGALRQTIVPGLRMPAGPGSEYRSPGNPEVVEHVHEILLA